MYPPIEGERERERGRKRCAPTVMDVPGLCFSITASAAAMAANDGDAVAAPAKRADTRKAKRREQRTNQIVCTRYMSDVLTTRGRASSASDVLFSTRRKLYKNPALFPHFFLLSPAYMHFYLDPYMETHFFPRKSRQDRLSAYTSIYKRYNLYTLLLNAVQVERNLYVFYFTINKKSNFSRLTL